jgi:hypothetical protein
MRGKSENRHSQKCDCSEAGEECEVPPTAWEPDSTRNFDDSNIRKQVSAFVGSAPQSVFTRNCSSYKNDYNRLLLAVLYRSYEVLYGTRYYWLDGLMKEDGTEVKCVLWDFGNTLAHEVLQHASTRFPDWPAAFEEVYAAQGDEWNAGQLSDDEFAGLMGQRLDAPASAIRDDLEERCGSIQFFPQSLRVVQKCPLPQVVVTVNPPLFSKSIVPKYPVFERFELIVISWQERTLDKAELCSIAVSRLRVPVARSAALLIDNISDNIKGWKKKGGRGYFFRDGDALTADLSGELADLGQVCGISVNA